MRSGDLLARLAGDRVGIPLPGTEDEGSRAFAGRIRAALATDGISVRTGQSGRDRDRGLLAAWTAAEELVAEDAPLTARAAPCAAPLTGGETALDALLDLVRRQLGAEVALITAIEGKHRYLRNTASAVATPFALGKALPSRGRSATG